MRGGGTYRGAGRERALLIQGLDMDGAKVGAARTYLQAQKLCGQVSVDVFDLPSLPFADNLINLVLMEEAGKFIRSGLALQEVRRVLSPNARFW